jgi:hypothetical protein
MMLEEKTESVVLYPPNADTIRHEVGKSGVAKILILANPWSGTVEGVSVVFDGGESRRYANMAMQYDRPGRKGRRA